MTRTMVYLSDEVHLGLKHLAVERRTSLAKLVREAVESTYAEDLEDLRIAQRRLRDLRRHSERAIPFTAYRAKRTKQ
jgi:predicted DNA-binding protein